MTVGFATATLLVALAGTAEAKPGPRASFEVQPAVTSGSVDLGKSGGYRFNLSMPTDRIAIFSISGYEIKGDRGSILSSIYVMHNRRSLAHGVIRARLGSRGSFFLRFRPNGQVRRRRVQRGCDGPPPVTDLGRFVGRATFHGEGGYLHFSLSGGAGGITHSFRLRCQKGEALDLAQRPLRAYVTPGSFFASRGYIALLYASARNHGRYIGITAGHLEESPPGAEVRVGAFESKEGMAIGHYGLALGPPGTLLTSLPAVHPATATLSPPAPFFGEANYQEKSARNWASTLGVNFPDVQLPLFGPGFHVRLCVLNPLKTRDGCDFFKAEPAFDERPARLSLMLR